jgi:hypothetical protein
MHGVVLSAFSRFAADRHGLELGAIDGDGAYPDEAFTALVAAAARDAGVPVDDVLRDFGRYAGSVAFVDLFPGYYASSPGTRAFLLDVEERIHEVVRATIAGAAPPRLTVVPLGEGGVVIGYTSDRGLCALLEGVVAGTAAYYDEAFLITHPSCMHRGDSACAVVVEPQ